MLGTQIIKMPVKIFHSSERNQELPLLEDEINHLLPIDRQIRIKVKREG
jgi:hypothetical protein